MKTLIAASDLGLHCLPMSQKWDAKLIWVNVSLQFRELFFAVSEKEIAMALTEQRNVGFRHVYNSAVVEGYCNQLMETLDTGTCTYITIR